MTDTTDDWVFQRRPWGWMIKLWHSAGLWVKVIRVYTRNSLQSHEHRTEYHVTFWSIKKIPPKEIHRMTAGWYIEIATGEPAEMDITRHQDDYGRK